MNCEICPSFISDKIDKNSSMISTGIPADMILCQIEDNLPVTWLPNCLTVSKMRIRKSCYNIGSTYAQRCRLPLRTSEPSDNPTGYIIITAINEMKPIERTKPVTPK